jgi:hypothetical protein
MPDQHRKVTLGDTFGIYGVAGALSCERLAPADLSANSTVSRPRCTLIFSGWISFDVVVRGKCCGYAGAGQRNGGHAGYRGNVVQRHSTSRKVNPSLFGACDFGSLLILLACRFRPNIVIKGAGAPFFEDILTEFTVDSHRESGEKASPIIQLVSKCTRCMVRICSRFPSKNRC